MLTRRFGGDNSALIRTTIFDEQGTPLRGLRGPKDAVSTACFSPDAKWIVTGARDKSIRQFDSESAEQLWIHAVDDTPRRVVSSHDGKFLAVLLENSHVQVRAADSGELVADVEWPGITCVALADSEGDLWAGTSSGTVLHYGLARAEKSSFEIGMAVRSIGVTSQRSATVCDAVGRVHTIGIGRR